MLGCRRWRGRMWWRGWWSRALLQMPLLWVVVLVVESELVYRRL